MSNITKKKRLRSTQNSNNLPNKEDSDIAKYFKDCLTFVPDITENSKLPKVQQSSEISKVNPSVKKLKSNFRSIKVKSRTDSFIPTKKLKSVLKEDTSNTISNDSKNKHNELTSIHLSIVKSQKSFTNSKSNVFNNITDSFISSKILSIQTLSDLNSQKRLELSNWGLPPLILEKYEALGVKTMFPWQVECLANQKILEQNKNLVYSAPTSAGKTLVAELLVLKTVLERRKKAIIILPFVSVVREKMFYFQDLLSDSGVRVEGFMGGVAPAGGFSSVHIAIATIEKANSLINRLMEDGDLVTLGAVVIDELHLLGDPGRGYLLELLLTKLRYMTLSLEHIDIQLIGMSATLPNLSLIADWLDAELYKTDFRPIPLNEQCKIGSSIFDTKLDIIRTIEAAPDIIDDTDNIIQLCIETINDGNGVLIFCPTKNWCEKLAIQLSSTFFQLGRDNTFHGKILRKNIDLTAVEEVLVQLQLCPVGLDNVLKKTVSFGVAFHHAGLTMDERDIIEGGFRVGSLKVLIATSTLSSGVNLPARRVIIRSPMFNGKPLDKLTYQQMIGRAGRMGKDTAGESILICKKNERTVAVNLMTSSLEPIESCLEGSGPLIRALLEAVASGVVRSPEDLDFYSKCTFIYKCDDNEVKEMVEEAVTFLISNEFLQNHNSDKNEQRLVATCLGKACLSASIPPREGLFLFEELQRARKCFVLDTELHVVYLVTPFNSGSQINQIDWMVFNELWRALSESERRVGQLVGVEERFLMTAMRGIIKPGKTLNIHRRFFTALALHDLVREVPLNVVCRKYNCCRGLLQSLQQSSSTFAGMVTNFCRELKWDCMELLFAQFQARLQFGVCRDLLDLLRLPSLNGLRARSLFNYGITTAAELATANELDVEQALNKALPFESEKDFDGENQAEIAKRTKMRTVFITGKDGLTAREAALIMIKEARFLVKHELGIHDVQWSQTNKSNNQTSPTSSIDGTTSFKKSSIIDSSPILKNVSVEVHAVPDKMGDSIIDKEPVKDNDELMKIIKNNNEFNVEKTIQIEKRLSTVHEIYSVSYEEKVDENEKAQIFTKNLKSKLGQKSNNSALMEKNIENTNFNVSRENENSQTILLTAKTKITQKTKIDNTEKPIISPNFVNSNESLLIYSEDVINVSEKIYSGSNTLRSELAEKTKSLLKENHLIDFQNNKNSSVKQKDNIDKNLSKAQGSEMRNIENNQSSESFKFSARVFDEIMKEVDVEKSNNVFAVPAAVIDAKMEIEKKRDSGGSNCSKSPSLFSDSSFLDPQICSILEKNVIDSACFNDFEKSNSTERNQKIEKNVNSRTTVRSSSMADFFKIEAVKENIPDKISAKVVGNKKKCEIDNQKENNLNEIEKTSRDNTQKNENKANSVKHSATPFTWVDDSWDQMKNLNLEKESNKAINENVEMESESPSLLMSSKIRTRSNSQVNKNSPLNKIQTTISKQKLPDIPSKSILRRRIFDKDDVKRSPVASIKTYATGKSYTPKLSLNKSDSDDSIISSQTNTRKKSVNKTRNRIEQKLLMNAEKFCKSTKIDNLTTKLINTESKLHIKQNTQLLFNDSSSDEESAGGESCLMFDSDDMIILEKEKVIKNKNEVSSGNEIKLMRSDSCVKDDEKINPKTIEPINVANSKHIFRQFCSYIEGSAQKERMNDLAIALVTEPYVKDQGIAIGKKIIGVEEKKKKEKKSDGYVYSDRKLCGVVISWGIKAIYYMPLNNTKETKLTIKERVNFLRDLLINTAVNFRCFDAKEVYKMLYGCLEIESRCNFLDPKAGDWLMNSDTHNKSYTQLAAQYFPRGIDIAAAYENNFGTYVLSGPTRAAAKSLLSWYITEGILNTIKENSHTLLTAYKEVEMPTIIILARMELRGFGINTTSLQELNAVIKDDLLRIEQKAFNLAGRKFNFYSSKEVSQVLGLNKKGRACTNKNVLRACENPISNLVTLWRKLNTVQTKIILPLLQVEAKNNRIHGNCITYTVTGRVSMHEPSLQTIPRDFKSDISGCVFSTRMAFVPISGNLILSADFCQLELRILAHFSQDPILCKLMHEQGDIFKNIAARLYKITEETVDDDMRQRAKQLCYAMIYGMGAKSLAEILSVTESEAKDYLESFMSTYKGIRIWLNAVSEQARIEGFVSTLADRRRILPGINSTIPAVKSQAERQAVNTKVQGSAADITKKAMVIIESKLQKEFSYTPITFPMVQNKRKLRRSDGDLKPRGGYLILQLHDELLYEVNSDDLRQVAFIVKDSMENAFKLRVPLPVKLRVGIAWGNLEEFKI